MAPPRATASSLSVSIAGLPSDPGAQEGESRKRVPKACDRCRLKKIKCDGQLPCSRCSVENSVCRYGERKATSDRRIPPGYVEYLEEQQQLLVLALKKSWSRIDTSQDDPSVHAILENLGVLTEFPLRHQRESGFTFEEDFDSLRDKCEAEASVVSSASATTSQVTSAEPTPAQSTPEIETGVSFQFQASRQHTWSPQTNPFQPSPAQTIGPRQPSPPVSNPAQFFLPQTTSAPSSVYESSTDIFQNPHWQPNALSHVHSEPLIVTAPDTYLQAPPWQSEQHRGSWPTEAHHSAPSYSTVDPADVMLATSTGPYFQSQEDWEQFYHRMQERSQRDDAPLPLLNT